MIPKCYTVFLIVILFITIQQCFMMASWFPLTDEVDLNGIRIYRDQDNLLHCGGLVCKQATYCYVTQRHNYPSRNVLTTFERCADLFNNTISERSFSSDSQELLDFTDDTTFEYGYVLNVNGTKVTHMKRKQRKS
ncbi:uncharacterized protein LOC129610424 [Condylostylus longicornis]|uniref:uncharacterized protein LOC129610424 n=1 Tax=Condylostylus longicornis TaxID=2530218 RepID=UPI00244DB18C|nr:uncharacterized protein LOC129610424 [Condylostylus longicornis]